MTEPRADTILRRLGMTGDDLREALTDTAPRGTAGSVSERAVTPTAELDAALRFRDLVEDAIDAAGPLGEFQAPVLREMADRRVRRAEAAVGRQRGRGSRFSEFMTEYDNDSVAMARGGQR